MLTYIIDFDLDPKGNHPLKCLLIRIRIENYQFYAKIYIYYLLNNLNQKDFSMSSMLTNEQTNTDLRNL